jgi:2-phosphosulfolactate phosphatase
MHKTVVIDSFPESLARYQKGYAIVAIDVVRATTTAITAVASGRRCFPVPTLEAALEAAGGLDNPLLVGEQRGVMPAGFHLNNSPSDLLARSDVQRPVVLLSSSGTRLCHEASKCTLALVACLRNYRFTADYLASHTDNVAIVGAGSRGEFREEDQLCCARIAGLLLDAGFLPEDRRTVEIVNEWSKKPVEAWLENKSAVYLRRTGQLADLKFILEHVNDLEALFMLNNGEVIMNSEAPGVRLHEDGAKGMYDA